MKILTACFLGSLLLLASGVAHSEVTRSSPQAFDVELEATVGKEPDAVWDALLEDTGMWWNPEGTISGEPRNVTLEAWAGGCICEALPDGGSARQLEVTMVSRDAGILRAIGGLGVLRELPVAGVFTLRIQAADGGGTRIHASYKVSGSGTVGALASTVDAALATQLSRLVNWIDHGNPAP